MSSADTPDIAVLGLGRMGTAIATRLAGQGCSVVGWTRSGREVRGVTTVSDPGAAVGRASVVLLCLFDGEACFNVIDRIRERLDGAVVVNTSTVSPREAEALARAVGNSGAEYVHAPVIGSLPAVAAGTLTILSGGAEPAAATPVLTALGETVVLSSPAEAAAAKLLANGALGNTLLALRAGKGFADELGLSEQAWSVLERTALGGMVRAKRERLEKGAFDDGDFTAAALAKDLALLAGTAPSAAELHAQVQGALDGGSVGADDDIAAFTVVPETERPHGLSLAPGVSAPPEVLAPLQHYVAGHATGQADHHRLAFWPTAHIEGVRDGRFVSWTLDEYCEVFTGRPAEDEATRRRRIDHVRWHGTVATATMTLYHGDSVFTDGFVLLQVDGEWRIANKVYHRAGAPAQ
ncbi:nuclear transport factor 2 family protein [Actinomadura sp. B10D3]|uniref:nuclear transport factor 2 family protein n=1 Tax=Actinomadura sp. B10D3 TaxID=3153557 RepID=UPI00325F5819